MPTIHQDALSSVGDTGVLHAVLESPLGVVNSASGGRLIGAWRVRLLIFGAEKIDHTENVDYLFAKRGHMGRGDIQVLLRNRSHTVAPYSCI